jgi:hypothetical protein
MSTRVVAQDSPPPTRATTLSSDSGEIRQSGLPARRLPIPPTPPRRTRCPSQCATLLINRHGRRPISQTCGLPCLARSPHRVVHVHTPSRSVRMPPVRVVKATPRRARSPSAARIQPIRAWSWHWGSWARRPCRNITCCSEPGLEASREAGSRRRRAHASSQARADQATYLCEGREVIESDDREYAYARRNRRGATNGGHGHGSSAADRCDGEQSRGVRQCRPLRPVVSDCSAQNANGEGSG